MTPITLLLEPDRCPSGAFSQLITKSHVKFATILWSSGHKLKQNLQKGGGGADLEDGYHLLLFGLLPVVSHIFSLYCMFY